MIYTDDCCCCIELRCGCIIIAIIEVLLRGADRYFVDRDTWLGFASLIISGIYVICCVLMLLGVLLTVSLLLLPYLLVALLRTIIIIWECSNMAMDGIIYNYIIFDLIQTVLGVYFCLVVYSYYSRLSDSEAS
ncbi:uncharacterized protein LOC115624695 [Scaptodrosophila lebanonensis]|uniref:Uncharacterized protein LOC115624695 n=1 Tax=Drosophila lebanonensis TaxID=7225 RepID=A0A6J2TJQ9_DROLE|nr:uncharacterized protein LOC115624695 [Scaptodrosophila lebanonensis]